MGLETCAEMERVADLAVATGAAVVLLAASPEAAEAFGVLERLLASPATRGLPVLVLAHRASPELRARMFAAGAADCWPALPEAGELAVRLGHLARGVLAERERDEARRQLAELQGRLQADRDQGVAGGIASRRRLDEFLDGEWRRARRNGSHLSLVLVEPAARPPVEVADLAFALKGALRRGGDLLASFDGGRFVAVLPEVGAGGAATVAEALRRAAGSVAPEVSLRLGVATLRPQEAPGSGPQALLAQAQAALG